MTADPGCDFREAPGPVRPDPAMISGGWTARFLVEPGRVEEMSELYRGAGFDVRACNVKPEDFDERCGTCPAVVCKSYLLLYTRARFRT
jgi:hypothetical protein